MLQTGYSRLDLSEPSPARERRSGADRRRAGFRSLTQGLYRGRRRAVRRPSDAAGPGYYLDFIDPRVLAGALVVMVCSCADTAFTLRLLQAGATEVNPLMRRLIELDTALFVAVKAAVTAAGLLVIVTHAHFRLLRLMRGRHAIHGLAGMYLALVTYQVVLLNLEM